MKKYKVYWERFKRALRVKGGEVTDLVNQKQDAILEPDDPIYHKKIHPDPEPEKGVLTRGGIDVWFFLIVLGLILYGVIMAYSASSIYAAQYHDDSTYFIKKHLIYLAIAMVGTVPFVFMARPWFWKFFAICAYAGAVVLLIAVLISGTVFGGDKLEHVIQKATELGAFEIVAFPSARCVSRPDDKSLKKKLERWQKIAASAAEQSARGRIPEVITLGSYKEALTRAAQSDKAILFYENERATTLKMALEQAPFSSVSLLSGPEGGFEDFLRQSERFERDMNAKGQKLPEYGTAAYWNAFKKWSEDQEGSTKL